MRRWGLAALAALMCAPAAAHAGQIEAGAAVVDETWHVGASAGQYATTRYDDPASDADINQEIDPFAQQVKNKPSYGVQARMTARAIVVRSGAQKFALCKIDLYIPQDLLWRRAAAIIASKHIGIDQHNLVMNVTHDHSSPYYTSTAWGAWTFQDVFDIRAYEYYAQRIADAVVAANRRLEPVRVGAARTQFALSNRNALGPALANDGTPAGFPNSYTDRDMTVVRFDSLRTGKPVASLVNFSIHPEDLSGNDLISADFIGPFERFMDREKGGVTIWTQNAVGNSEDERNTYHSVHQRLIFDHREYGQAEYNARLMANAAGGLFDDIGAGHGAVNWFADGKLAFDNEWFPGPLTHPYPAVSNCRTETALAGNPQLPIVGLPDCAGPSSAFDQVGMQPPPTPPIDPGITPEQLKRLGIPVPDNYGALAYTGLEEDLSVHLQAFRIGDILFTVCSCEQWADQARNIKSRTDRVAGDEWAGFDYASYRGLDDTGVECFERPPYDGAHWSCPHPETAQTTPCFAVGDGTWSCPNPKTECLLKGDAFTNTCGDATGNASLRDSRLLIPDTNFKRMRAQVRNCANGWNSVAFAPYAESEPLDVNAIKGNYTCDDGAQSAALGYALTVPISMANDYNGYIATYREYQRGDHYRKALTGWGPHSSDYMATRLVKMGRRLNGGPALDQTVDGAADPDADNAVLMAKTQADQANNDARVAGLGALAATVTKSYEAALPDDAGPAQQRGAPRSIERFDETVFSWRGGSNYTDNPAVEVQRRVDGSWMKFADESGEVPVTLALPHASDLPVFAAGKHSWIWTGHFEAFVSEYDLGGPRATPAGTYRFHVHGLIRRGGKARGYQLDSKPFTVSPWSGITVSDLRREPDGNVSLALGPRHDRAVPGGNPTTASIGPIDFPDTYTHADRARFVRLQRTLVRDPAAPGDPSRFEWFCLTCSFRPWMDTTDGSSVTVTYTGPGGHTRTVPAHRVGDRWVTSSPPRPGERASVRAGDAVDAWGDFNGAASPGV
jgi:hypothetical protein